MALSSLFSRPEQMRVERAVAEVRAGRPVVLDSGAEARLVQAAEELDDGRLAALAALAGANGLELVISPERARWIGLEPAAGARAVALVLPADVTVARVAALIFDDKPDLAGIAAADDGFDHCVTLELTRIARLVPAVVTLPLPAGQEADFRQIAAVVAASDIAAHAPETARAMTIVADAPVPLRPDISSRFVVFRGGETVHDQVAIVIGAPDLSQPVPLRLHSACLTGDLFGSLKCDCGDQLRMAVERFAELGGGIVLYLDQEGRGIGIANKMRAYALQADGYDTVDADARLGFHLDERRWYDAGQMLALLGIRSVRLHSNNPRKEEALKEAGIEVVSREPVLARVTAENAKYLRTKVQRAGHIIDEEWIDRAEAATTSRHSAAE